MVVYRKFFSVSCQRQGNRWTEDCGWVPCNRCWDLHKSKCRCTQLNRREIYAIARPWKLRYCGQTRKLGLRDGLLWHRWCGVPSWFWPTGGAQIYLLPERICLDARKKTSGGIGKSSATTTIEKWWTLDMTATSSSGNLTGKQLLEVAGADFEGPGR